MELLEHVYVMTNDNKKKTMKKISVSWVWLLLLLVRPLGQHKAIASVVSGLENREPHHLGVLVVLGHIDHWDNHQTIVAAVPTSEDPIVAGIIFGVNIISQIQMDEE